MMDFNAEQFLATQTTDANSTSDTPVPEGEYNAIIESIKPRQNKDGSVVMDVVHMVDDADVKTLLGRDVVRVRQSVWLDYTPAGNLDMGTGKNAQLGRLRAAVGQNTPGKPWSPAQLVGQVLRVKVAHKANKETGEPEASVVRVAPLN